MSGVLNGVKIFPKLLVSVLVVAAIPVSGLWYVTIVQYQQQIEDKLRSELAHVGDVLSGKVNSWTEMNLRVLQQNASLPEMESMVTAQQEPVLGSVLHAYEWNYLVYAMGMDGFMNARVDSDGLERPIYKSEGEKAFYRGDREYFRQIVEGQSFGQQVLLSRTLGVPALILCAPILNPHFTLASAADNRSGKAVNQRRNGALCSGMLLEDIASLVAEAELGQTGHAILVDHQHRVISHGKSEVLLEKLQDFSTHPLIKQSVSGYGEFEYEGVRKIGYRIPAGKGWTLLVEKDHSEAFQPVREAQQRAFVFLGATLMLSIVVAYLVSRRIARPIQTLTDVAEGISKGKFSREKLAESARGDEIGALARAVERMAASIEIAFRKIRQGNSTKS